MENASAEQLVKNFLALADIEVNGWRLSDILVANDRCFKRLVAGGSMALEESYMDGWWECQALDRFFDPVLRIKRDPMVKKSVNAICCGLKAACTSSPSRFRAFAIGRRHHDIGNELFRPMPDRWVNDSCVYWKDADSPDGVASPFRNQRGAHPPPL